MSSVSFLCRSGFYYQPWGVVGPLHEKTSEVIRGGSGESKLVSDSPGSHMKTDMEPENEDLEDEFPF